MVASKHTAHQLLEQIEFFVGAARGDQPGDRVGAVFLLERAEAVYDKMHGLQPWFFNELVAFTDERVLQPCVAIDVFKAESSAYTDPSVALCGIRPVTPFVLP